MAKTADMQEVSLTLIKPYERNAKIHGEKQIEKLKQSIREFGFVNPCLIDREYNLIAGHGRVIAAKELGYETVPCVFVEGLTDEQRRAYILADNRLSELGEWNMAFVTEELQELDADGFNIDLTGFDLTIGEIEERTDRQIQLKESISVIVECEDEEQAEEVYNRLIEDGLKCRISTL